MSPRAAWRLERLGFERVYDYAPGKSDWTASGLPTQGKYASIPRPGGLAVRDVPVCAPDDRVEEIEKRPEVERAGFCIVLISNGVVLGRLRTRHMTGAGDAVAEDVMDPGPTSVRADEFLPDLVERMSQADVETILVTDAEGKLIGVLYRADAEKKLQELHAQHHHHHEHG